MAARGQPADPGPSYAYGSARGGRVQARPRFLGAIITLAVIIVLGVVVGNLGPVRLGLDAVPSAPSASAGHQAHRAVGSSF